jgi:hypothetical protein
LILKGIQQHMQHDSMMAEFTEKRSAGSYRSPQLNYPGKLTELTQMLLFIVLLTYVNIPKKNIIFFLQSCPVCTDLLYQIRLLNCDTCKAATVVGKANTDA